MGSFVNVRSHAAASFLSAAVTVIYGWGEWGEQIALIQAQAQAPQLPSPTKTSLYFLSQ